MIHWTSTKPSKPGWWWHRGVKSTIPEVVKITAWKNGEMVVRYCGDSISYTLPLENERGNHGQWSSEPVEMPEAQP